MSALAAVVAKDLRSAVRSGFFLLVGIVTPLALAFIFNLVFSGATSGRTEIPTGLVDQDGSPTSANLVDFLDVLDEDDVLAVTRIESTADPAAALEDDELDAVVVIPDGFGAALGAGGGRASLRVVESSSATTSAGIVRSIVTGFAEQLDRTQIAADAATRLGVTPPGGPPGQQVEFTQSRARGGLDASASITATMATMFMFIIALIGMAGLLEERRQGTLARLFAAPIPRIIIPAAKAVVTVALGVLSVTVLVLGAWLLMDAEWGDPVGVALLIIAISLVATALTTLVTGFANTMDGAAGVQSALAVALALLGGGMIPLPDDGFIGVLSRLSPHHWFLDGLGTLAEGEAWTAVLPTVGVLIGFALVLGVPGALVLNRRFGA